MAEGCGARLAVSAEGDSGILDGGSATGGCGAYSGPGGAVGGVGAGHRRADADESQPDRGHGAGAGIGGVAVEVAAAGGVPLEVDALSGSGDEGCVARRGSGPGDVVAQYDACFAPGAGVVLWGVRALTVVWARVREQGFVELHAVPEPLGAA